MECPAPPSHYRCEVALSYSSTIYATRISYSISLFFELECVVEPAEDVRDMDWLALPELPEVSCPIAAIRRMETGKANDAVTTPVASALIIFRSMFCSSVEKKCVRVHLEINAAIAWGA